MTLRIALVALARTSLAGCPDSTPNDAGRDAVTLDAPALNDSAPGTLVDAFAAGDAFATGDAFAAGDAFSADAFSADAFTSGDAFSADARTRDARAAAPGMCNPEACTPTCFRPIRCVTECGGPVTECGCCECAAGSIDTIGCGSEM